MYDFHYNVMKPKYNENVTLMCMDTDSFIHNIETDGFYKDMKAMIDYFEASDYKENNIYNIPCHKKKILGKMTNENNEIIFRKFIGLRSKMHAIKLDDKDIKKNPKESRNLQLKIKSHLMIIKTVYLIKQLMIEL